MNNISKVWMITGAARGFGLEIAQAVLETGDKVIATVRSKPEELAARLNNNPNLLVTVLDITDEEAAKQTAARSVAAFGSIDVLVNNAGYGLLSAVEEATGDEVRRNFETNVFGTLNMVRAVLPHMRERRSGHIINISSVGGLGAYAGWGVYGSTKFAVEGLTEALALELAPLGIHATVVAPGFFRTDFLDTSSLTRTSNVIDDYADTVGAMRSFATEANKKQPGDPKKLAQAFIKLANAEKPPVHLPLGNDTLARYAQKTADFQQDIANWQEVITGTDHDDVK
ncbi:oxidoreductase [Paenibacillus sp. R14(2021)]|uniref:oxidoreductase n=1 Tax=Paenibacillus sp. R14(2021) TaxID=2859228 RepID=UPI001C6117CB|nr:oxidoreductase [Paenibacillus sp. R14(2021)]